MLTKNIKNMKSEIAKHIKADAVIQGSYWDGGKGCFIGCLAHSDDADVLSEKYGIPFTTVSLLENIFESLPKKDAVSFFSDIGDAISVDNKDLSLVHYAFLRDILKRLPERSRITQDVISGLDLLANGKKWPEQKAVRVAARPAANSAANSAAYWAAYYAACDTVWAVANDWYARNDAANAAANAAYMSAKAVACVADNYEKERKLQAALILQLLKDAPIMKDTNGNANKETCENCREYNGEDTCAGKQEPHICPYREDISGNLTLCDCCENERNECCASI